jgi:hypothetical protein
MGSHKVSTIQRVVRYLRRDFKEIVWPSPMKDPPNSDRPISSLTFKEHREVWIGAWEMYKESWVNVFKRQEAEEEDNASEREADDTKVDARAEDHEPSTSDTNEGKLLADEVKKTFRSGKMGLKPFVTYLYETRGVAYRDGVREFIKSYREGFKEIQHEYETEPDKSLSEKAAAMMRQAEDVLERAEKSEPVKLDDDVEERK